MNSHKSVQFLMFSNGGVIFAQALFSFLFKYESEISGTLCEMTSTVITSSHSYFFDFMWKLSLINNLKGPFKENSSSQYFTFHLFI